MNSTKLKSVLIGFVLALFALCEVNLAQNGYNYDRPDLGLGIASTSRPGFGVTSPGGYPSPSGFGGVAGPTTPAYQAGSTGYPSGRPSGPAFGPTGAAGPTGNAGYPSAGQPASPTGSAGYPAAGQPAGPTGSAGYPAASQPDFTGTGSFQGSPAGTGFGTAPGYPGENAGFPASGGRPVSGNVAQQRPGTAPGAGISPSQPGQQPGLSGGPGSSNDGQYEGGDYSAIPGEPGVDYPIFSEIPETSFDCNQQQYPGYYADVEAQCQVFHICALNRTFNFLCPNGTIFSQEHFVCVWWNQFDCASAPGLFEKNANLYDNAQAGRPSTDGFSGLQPGTAPGAGGLAGPAGPTAGGAPYPGRPQGGRPGAAPVGPSAGAPGYPSGPAGGYPGGRPSIGFQPSGQIPSNAPTAYPAAGTPSGPSFPTGPSQQGYPAAGAPSGPSFPTGPSQQGYPAAGQPDGQFASSPQTPTREYLPPRQG